MIFFEEVYKFHGAGVLYQDPCQQMNSSSFIFTNLRVGFELWADGLIWVPPPKLV
jgi:hypothetical protein